MRETALGVKLGTEVKRGELPLDRATDLAMKAASRDTLAVLGETGVISVFGLRSRLADLATLVVQDQMIKNYLDDSLAHVRQAAMEANEAQIGQVVEAMGQDLGDCYLPRYVESLLRNGLARAVNLYQRGKKAEMKTMVGNCHTLLINDPEFSKAQMFYLVRAGQSVT